MEIICQGKQLGKNASISGRLTILENLNDINEVKKGDIVYFGERLDNVDTFYVTFRCIQNGAFGFIRLGGGSNDHGSIVAKEIGINYLKVDNDLSQYRNKKVSLHENKVLIGEKKFTEKKIDYKKPDASIKIKLNMSFFGNKSLKNILSCTDGVGFSRFEFILVQVLNGYHPIEFIKRFGEKHLIDNITKLIMPVAKELKLQEKEFWIRTDDFTSNDLYSMQGGKEYEVYEQVTSSGYRGIRRSISDEKIINPQFKAVSKLISEGMDNIKIFPPMTNSINEFNIWKAIGNSHHIPNSSFGLMVETPRAAFMIEEFLDHINFVVFGTNDLTQFLLAADRNNSRLSNIFNEEDQFVTKAISNVVSRCKEKNIETFIGGNAATNINFIKKLVDVGLTGVSVVPDESIISELKCEFEI